MTEPNVNPGDLLVGKYRVDRVLGAGGMGFVVAATDETLERRVAIKFLHGNWAEQAPAVARFLREARAAAKLHGEHVVRVIEVGTLDSGEPYMVMEYLEGGDLSDELARRGPLPVSDVVDWVLQACDGIAEAHAAKIVHRDLKPANLFLAQRPDGTRAVKVLDFGISKQTEPGEQSLTSTGGMMGSPLYMSPEQMRSAKNVDHRADIWSLGAILYELLGGAPPYESDTMSGLVAAVLETDAVPLSSVRPDVPAGLSGAVMRALSKDPDERFQNVGALAASIAGFGTKQAIDSLERIQRVLSRAGVDHSLPPPRSNATLAFAATAQSDPGANTAGNWAGTQPQQGKPRGNAAIVAAGLVGLLGLGAVGIFALRGGGEPAQGTDAAIANDSPAPASSVPAEPTSESPSEVVPEAEDESDAGSEEATSSPSETARPTAPPTKQPTPKPSTTAQKTPSPTTTPKKPVTPAPSPAPAPTGTGSRKFGARK